MDSKQSKRHFYLDNLKVFLTCIVIFHHLAIAYGGEGLFIIKTASSPSVVGSAALTGILAINQSFFMGLFFLISAYFSYKSLSRKNTKDFIIGKIKRLLIPALLYFFVIAPLIQIIIGVFYKGLSLAEIGYDPDIGPLWFLLALFIFDIVFAVVKDKIRYICNIPSKKIIYLTLILVGIIAWCMRILSPVGVTIPVVSFQLAHFAQYIFAYYLGTLISRNNWLEQITKNTTKVLLYLIPCILAFGVGVALTYIKYGNADTTMGGLNITALLYAIWEQLMFMIMSVGLLSLFKNRFNRTSRTLGYMSANAFNAYVIHFLIIAVVVIMLSALNLNHYISLVVAVVLSIGASFLLGRLVKPIMSL